MTEESCNIILPVYKIRINVHIIKTVFLCLSEPTLSQRRRLQSWKLTVAKTLNACKKCQLRLQILEQGKLLRLDIVSPRYTVLLRNSFRQPFAGSHTFDLLEVFGIFRLSNAVQSLETTRMSRALDIVNHRPVIVTLNVVLHSRFSECFV